MSGNNDVNDFLPVPFEWCEIPAGTVNVSDPKSRFRDKDYTETFNVRPFYLAKYPVTCAQFQTFLDAPGQDKDRFGQPRWPVDSHPRENVSWYDAIDFWAWLKIPRS